MARFRAISPGFGELNFVVRGNQAHAHVDHFDRSMWIGVTVTLAVLAVKTLQHCSPSRDIQFISLPGVANISRADSDAGQPLLAKLGHTDGFEGGEMGL